MLNVFTTPPTSPYACIFARTTHCVSSDFTTIVTPCQFGGNPDCQNCGCIASAGLEAIGRHRIKGVIPLNQFFHGSIAIGQTVARLRRRGTTAAPVGPRPSSTAA
jgi:hypothetical protein